MTPLTRTLARYLPVAARGPALVLVYAGVILALLLLVGDPRPGDHNPYLDLQRTQTG